MLVEVSTRKEILDEKVNQLETLLEEISNEIGIMEVDKKLDEFIDDLRDMLEVLYTSQNAVRKACCLYITEKYKIP